MEKKRSGLSVFLAGIIKENPVLVFVFGTCPAFAVSTMAVNGLGMCVAATALLVCSNIFISLLIDIISDTVRISCYIFVIAGFTICVQLLVQAYAPAVY